MEVRELAHKPATTCREGTPIGEVAQIMRHENVGSVVVLSKQGGMIGIVTDRDILCRGVADGMETSTPVDKVMTRDVDFLYENADVISAANEMAEKGLRRLPVLDFQGHLTGVVAFDDLVIAFSEQLGRLAHAVRKEIAGAHS